MPVILILSSVVLTELVYIYFVIGTSYGDYSGISVLSFKQYLTLFINLSCYDTNLLAIGFLTFLFLSDIYLKIFKKIDIDLRKYIYLIILFLLIVIPQIILHSKSGFQPRYFLPVGIAYSAIIMYSLKFLKSVEINNFLKMLCKILVILLCLVQFIYCYTQAVISAEKGISVKKTLEFIKDNTNKDSKIIIISDPIISSSEINSFQLYIKEFTNRENIYIFPVIQKKSLEKYDEKHNEKLIKKFIKKHENKILRKKEDYVGSEMVIAFNINNYQIEQNASYFLGSNDFSTENIGTENISIFKVYYVNNNESE